MATATTPKLAGMKFLVEKVLHPDDHGTVVLIGDQGNLGKHYALKKIKRDEPDPDDYYIERARATHEACQEQKLSQSVFVQYYDFVLKRKWLKVSEAELLMEYVQGKSLADVGRLEIGQYVLVFEQLASAVALLHRRKVLHGDLKVGNAMISKTGQVKLLNYGLAPVQAKFPNQLVGDNEYAAPEHIKEKVLDEKTDLYAFGATMYRAVTGRAANSGTRLVGESGKIPIPSALNSSVPTRLSNLIVNCLQSSVDRRPESMYEVHRQLEDMVKQMNLEPEQLKGVTLSKQE
jgi:serine/threonine-protein kinase